MNSAAGGVLPADGSKYTQSARHRAVYKHSPRVMSACPTSRLRRICGRDNLTLTLPRSPKTVHPVTPSEVNAVAKLAAIQLADRVGTQTVFTVVAFLPLPYSRS